MSKSEKLDADVVERSRASELSRRDLIRWAGIAGVGGLGTFLPSCSDPPGQDVVSTTTQPTALRIGGSANGRVTGLFDGNATTGATVRIVGIGSTTTDAAGEFSFRIYRSGDFELIIRGDDFVTRRTAVRITGSVTFSVTVMEKSAALSDDFLNQFARRTGPSFGPDVLDPGAIARWEQSPTIRVYTRVAGTKAKLSDRRVDKVIEIINMQYPKFTAGALGFVANVVEINEAPPDPSTLPLGTLCFYQTDDDTRGAGQMRRVQNRYAIGTSFCFTGNEDSGGVLSRVFGQALGAGGVVNTTPSTMNGQGRVNFTEQDTLAAQVLYTRPPGNMDPDTDPADVFIAGG